MANSPFGNTGPRPIDPSLLPWLDLDPLQYRYIPSPPSPNGPAIPYGAPVLSARRPNLTAPQDRNAALFDTDAAIRKALADRAAQAPITGTAMRAGKQSREALDRGDYLGAILTAMTGGMTALVEADPRSLGGRGGRNMMGESPAQQAINAQIRFQSPVGRAIGANFGTGVRQYYASDPMRAFGGIAPNSRWGAPTGSYAEVEPAPPRPSWFDRLAARTAGTMFAGVPIPPPRPTPKPAPRPAPEGAQKLPTTGPISPQRTLIPVPPTHPKHPSQQPENQYGPIGGFSSDNKYRKRIFYARETSSPRDPRTFPVAASVGVPLDVVFDEMRRRGVPGIAPEEETEFNSRQAERAFIGSEQHRAMSDKDRLKIFFHYFPHMKDIANSPDKYVGDYVPKYMLDSYGVSELLPARPVANQFTPSPELSEPGVGPAKAWRSSADLSAPEAAGEFVRPLTAADVTAVRSEPPLFTKENLEQWSALEQAGALDPARMAPPGQVVQGDVYEMNPRTGDAVLDFPSDTKPYSYPEPQKYGYLGAGLPANPSAPPTRQISAPPYPQSPLPNPDLMELREQRASRTADKLDAALANASPMQRALWTALLKKFEEEAAIGKSRPLLKIKKNDLSEASIEQLERRDDPSPPKWMEQTHNKSGTEWWGTEARGEAAQFVAALMQALSSPTIELGDGKTGKVLKYRGQSTAVSFDNLREMIENYAVQRWHRTSEPLTVSEIAASIDEDYPNLTPEAKTAMLEARLMRQSERASTEFSAPEYSAQNEDVLKDTRYEAEEYAGTKNDKRKLIENESAKEEKVNLPATKRVRAGKRSRITILRDRFFFRDKLSDDDWANIRRHLPSYKGARTNVDPQYYSIPTLTSDKKKPGGIDFVGIDVDAMNAKIDYKTPGFEQRRAAIQEAGAYPKNPTPYRGTQLRDFAFFVDQDKVAELTANGRELGKDYSLFDVLQDDLRAALSDGRAINLDDRMTRNDGIAWLKALRTLKQTKAVDAAIAKNRRLIIGTGVRDAIANAFAANDAPSSTGEVPGIGRTVAKPAFMMASEIQDILEKGGKSEAVFRYLMNQNTAAGGLPIRTVLDVMNALSSGVDADVNVPVGTALIFGTPKNGVIPEMGVGKADATIFPNQQIRQAVVQRDPAENEQRVARGEQRLPQTRNAYAPTHRPYVRFRGPKTEEKYTIKPKAEQAPNTPSTQPEQLTRTITSFNVVSDQSKADVSTMRSGSNNMLNTAPGNPGWLGNPWKWEGNGGPKGVTRQEAVEKYRTAFFEKASSDPVFANAVRELRGKNLYYYQGPDGAEGSHVNVINDWLAQDKPTTPAQPAAPPSAKKSINIYYSAGENAILSNLAPRPFYIKQLDGTTRPFTSVEHAYQTYKSGAFDQETYDKYFAPGARKKISGNKGTKTDNDYHFKLMEKLIRMSLEQNPDVAKALLDTGDAQLTHKQDKGVWQRAFPEIMMRIREELRAKESDRLAQDKPATPAQSQPPTTTTTTQPKSFKVIEYHEDKWTLAGIKTLTSSFKLSGIPEPIYVFGDNLEGTGRGGQAVIRGHADAYGIPTKRSPKTSKDAYFGNPANEQEEAAAITAAVDRIIDLAQRTGRMVILPKAGLGTGLAKLEQKSPRLFAHLQSEIARLKAAQEGTQPTQQPSGGGVVPMTGSNNKRGLTGDFRRPTKERRGPVDEFGRPLRNIRFASRAVKEGRPDLDARVLYRDKPVQSDVEAFHGHKVSYSGLPDPEQSRLGMRHAGYGAYFTLTKGVAVSYGEYLKHIKLNPKARFLHLDRPVPDAVLNAAIRRYLNLEEGHEVNPDPIDTSKLDFYQNQKLKELLNRAAKVSKLHTTNLLDKTNAKPQSFGFTTDPRHVTKQNRPITGLGLNLALQDLAARGPNGPSDWFDIGHISRDLGYSGQTHVGGTFVGKGAHKVFVYTNKKAASLIRETTSDDTKSTVVKSAALIKLVTTMAKQSNASTAIRDLFFINPKSDPPELPKQVDQLLNDFEDDPDILNSYIFIHSHMSPLDKYEALEKAIAHKNADHVAKSPDKLVRDDTAEARLLASVTVRTTNEDYGILANLRHRAALKYISDRFKYDTKDLELGSQKKNNAAIFRLSKNIGLSLKEKYKVNPSVFEPLLFCWLDSHAYSDKDENQKLNQLIKSRGPYYPADFEYLVVTRLLETGRFDATSAAKTATEVGKTLRGLVNFEGFDGVSIRSRLKQIKEKNRLNPHNATWPHPDWFDEYYKHSLENDMDIPF